jgi:hypothetical protein
MNTSAEVSEKLKFIDGTPDSLIAYTIDNYANGDNWKTVFVAFNAGSEEETVTLPANTTWNIVANGEKAGVETLSTFEGASVKVPAMSTVVAYDAAAVKAIPASKDAAEVKKPINSSLIVLSVLAGLLILSAAGYALLKMRKKA